MVILGTAGSSTAAAAAFSIGTDGKTEPIHTYADAIRERVMIPQPGIDQDEDGEDDKIAVDIIRPAGTGPSTQVPAIIMPSPYFTTLCRGLESECMEDKDGDGVNDIWPMFYDNYFLPRGYAYVLAQANGTGHSTGCPLHGGPGDVEGMRSVIDWLNGRADGETTGGTPVHATWHNGSSAMIGKSYDGTFANGVAATGVEGLKTIVPITAISAWYNYSRTGGVRHNTHYPRSLSNTITNPDRRAHCAPTRDWLDTVDGDLTGDYNDFWEERNHNKDAANVTASVFAVQGFQDDNVRMDHMSMWWDALTANDVPRKLWLLRSGHTDPFDARRAEWVDTLHRWFDHYLFDIDNGIEDEPMVTIEDEKDVWVDYTDWPIPGTEDLDLYLRAGSAGEPGTLGGSPGGGESDTQSYVGGNVSEGTYINNPQGIRSDRLIFLSQELTEDVRLSGAGKLKLRAALDKPQSNLSAILVDYGSGTQVTRTGNGTQTTSTETCWGDPGEYDRNCFREITKPTSNVTQWRVSRGLLDSSNRNSLWLAETVTPGEFNTFEIPMMATEHVFEAGHRIGIVLATHLFGTNGTFGTQVTVDTHQSAMSLPIVGGYPTAVEASITDLDTTPPSLENMPEDVEMDLTDPDGELIDYTLPTAVDDEDPSPTVSCDPPPGSRFGVGTTTVTCEAKDLTGNTEQATFKVTITDPNAQPEPGPGGEEDPADHEQPADPPVADSSAPPVTSPKTAPRANRKPHAHFLARKLRTRTQGAPRSRIAPQQYRLDARRSRDRDGRIVSYRWLSGGRVIARTAVAVITVTRPTQVTLEVVDNRGARARRSTTLQPRRLRSATVTRTLTYCNGCARPRGAQLRRLLSLRPLLDRATQIRIEGHTAGPGPELENQRFAERRARLAARILLKGARGSIPLTIRSFGDNRPVASNRDETGQAENRRVEVRLTVLRG